MMMATVITGIAANRKDGVMMQSERSIPLISLFKSSAHEDVMK